MLLSTLPEPRRRGAQRNLGVKEAVSAGVDSKVTGQMRLELRRIVSSAATSLATIVCPNELKLVVQELSEFQKHARPRSDQTAARLTLALMAAEDHRFLLHMGVELRSMLRAAGGVITGRYSGGSTIEQQLIRVVRGRYEFTIYRKLTEIILALSIYELFDKVEIAKMYTEIAYYGWRGAGLENISRRLGYNLNDISQEQAVILASLLKRPLPRYPSPDYAGKLEQRMSYVQKRFILVRALEAAYDLVERARL